jgi:preprotein translocase subunit SecG
MYVVSHLLMILLLLTALVLIVLVLIQRGKGGGLSGAFGGMGGQSAFGTKAGDLFTKITIVVAAFWIVLCIVSALVLGKGGGGLLSPTGGTRPPAPSAPASPDKPPAGGEAPAPAAPAPPAKTPGK